MTRKARQTEDRGDAESGRGGRSLRVAFSLSEELIEAARDAAYWARVSLSEMAVAGLTAEIKRLQKQHNSGEPFPKRTGRLKTGPRVG